MSFKTMPKIKGKLRPAPRGLHVQQEHPQGGVVRKLTLNQLRTALENHLKQSPEPPALRLHPSLLDPFYRTKIRNLASTLRDPDLKTEATEALRGLISEIRMVPDARAPNGHHIELAGDLAGILALGDAQTTRPAASAGLKSVTMVAGVGFEPTTFRL